MEFIDYLVITEKPSAMRNFSEALGGERGQLENGGNYQLVSLQGHIMRLLEPHQMVDPVLADKIKRWSIPVNESEIWDHRVFNWAKEILPSKEKVLENLRSFLPRTKNIVIATDNDPSGEGDLLVWEILDYLHNNRPVLRLDFSDESRNAILRAFRNMKQVDSSLNVPVRKAEIRQRFDFLTQQYVRIATNLTQPALDKREVINEGRLKTIILSKIYTQFELNRSFMPDTTYKIKYVDNDEVGENAHKFTDRDEEHIFNSPIEAKNGIASMVEEATVIEEDVKYSKRPIPILPDLSTLSGQMAKLGAKSKDILETYQKMYEMGYVSYPRTQDRKITNEQFEELRPVSESIATVIEADKSVLDFRKPSTLLAKRFIEDGGSHGANRPGTKVPNSLQELDSFGEYAKAIYLYLARRFLALFSRDATIATYSAHLEEYPKMTASKSIIVEPNWYLIIEPTKSYITLWEGFGKVAFPVVDEAVTSRPPLMTQKTLMEFLFRQQIGTGATRVQTLAKLVDENMVIEETGGILTNSEKGMLGAKIMQGTMLASQDTTKFLHKQIEDYGKGYISDDQVLSQVKEMLKNDIPIMKANSSSDNSQDISTFSKDVSPSVHQNSNDNDSTLPVQEIVDNNSETRPTTPINIEPTILEHSRKVELHKDVNNEMGSDIQPAVKTYEEVSKEEVYVHQAEKEKTPLDNEEMTTDAFISEILGRYDVVPKETLPKQAESDPISTKTGKDELDTGAPSIHTTVKQEIPGLNKEQSKPVSVPPVNVVDKNVDFSDVIPTSAAASIQQVDVADNPISKSAPEKVSSTKSDIDSSGQANLSVVDGKLQYEDRTYIWTIEGVSEISAYNMKLLINEGSVQLRETKALLDERVVNGVTIREIYQEEFIL